MHHSDMPTLCLAEFRFKLNPNQNYVLGVKEIKICVPSRELVTVTYTKLHWSRMTP